MQSTRPTDQSNPEEVFYTLRFSSKLKFIFLKAYFEIDELPLPLFWGTPKNEGQGTSGQIIPYKKPPKVFRKPPFPCAFCLPYLLNEKTCRYLSRISFASIVRRFFNFPDMAGSSWLGIIGKTIGYILFSPRILLNIAKIFTEVLPSIGAGLLQSAFDFFDKKAHEKDLAPLPKFLFNTAAFIFGYVLPPFMRLLHFTGRATTSPMRCARDAWNIFACLRNDDPDRTKALGLTTTNFLKKLGYVLGAAAFLYSIATTVTVYFFLSPYLGIAGSWLAGKLGLSSLGVKIVGGIKSIPVVGPWLINSANVVANSFTQVVGPAVAKGLVAVSQFIAPYLGKLASALAALASKPLVLLVATSMPILGNFVARPLYGVMKKIKDKIFEKKSSLFETAEESLTTSHKKAGRFNRCLSHFYCSPKTEPVQESAPIVVKVKADKQNCCSGFFLGSNVRPQPAVNESIFKATEEFKA